jgi:outer membrane protein OmpA-like peptidoglycan-associated protein
MLAVGILVTGCATKKYVRNNVTPVQAKLDQVADQSNKQGEQLQQTQKDVQKNTTDIAATDEKATGADRRAGDAMTRAQQADTKATQNTQQIASVRDTFGNAITNLDNYKVVQSATVLFPFDSAQLKKDEMAQLDQLISQTSSLKRYFIAIEGYTDTTGDPQYNVELSKRRADAVVQYLAGQKDVDFNRIHMIGFGEVKPVDEGKNKDARAKNRRVEVKIYSADDALQGISGSQNGGTSAQGNQRGSN